MAGKQRKSDDPFARNLGKPLDKVITPTQPFEPLERDPLIKVERAVRSELMPFDLHGQRSRELEIIRLLEEISRKLDGK